MHRWLLSLILAMAFGVPARVDASSAVPLVYATGPQSSQIWTVPVFAVPQGASLTFVNLDTVRHDFVAQQFGPDTQPWCSDPGFPAGQCPLFYSDLVGVTGTAPVLGLENLVPGQTYTFICLIHPMRGTLLALPALPV